MTANQRHATFGTIVVFDIFYLRGACGSWRRVDLFGTNFVILGFLAVDFMEKMH